MEPVRRTFEIEDVTNLYVIHPLSARLVPFLAALRITPNMVSLTGMAFGIAAAFAYFHYRDVRFTLLGFVFMLTWHVLDGADGQLARLTHAQSALGKVLDGICDYVTFIAVYIALALALGGGGVWFVVVAAGICHAFQSAAYEAQREAYIFWVHGLGALPGSLHPGPGGVAGLLDRAYRLMERASTPLPEPIRAKLVAAARDRDDFAQRYHHMFARPLRRWSVLSANYRTIGIFIAALAGAPLCYFWFEIVGFSAILAVLHVRQRVRLERFAVSLA